MPPEPRLVPRFAAEPPQELLPYGRWAEQLREELRRGPSDGSGGAASVAATRSLAERFWPVTAERDVGHGPKAFVKRVLRKLMRWYVEPLAYDQRSFNAATLRLIDDLQEQVDRLQAELAPSRPHRRGGLAVERPARLALVGEGDGAAEAVSGRHFVPPHPAAAR